MYKQANMAVWQGRVDNEETDPALRWHQNVHCWDQQADLVKSPTLLGFACDEGVRRNKGRVGARNGPYAIRNALANMAYFHNEPTFDAGNVFCNSTDLEQAQTVLTKHITAILQHNGFPLVLGGGHEVAWGSFLGIAHYLKKVGENRRIGIINFDAHFDLRNPQYQASSGTPFRQIAQWCETNNRPFNYCVLGLNPTANTSALFKFAEQHQVTWYEDSHCTLYQFNELIAGLSCFLQHVDDLYLSICMDVFPASVAPGVSAPCALGVNPVVIIQLIKTVKELCNKYQLNFIMADIAEMNPQYDHGNMTAKLAARLIHEIVQ